MRKAMVLGLVMLVLLMPAAAWANSPGTIVIKDVNVIYNRSLTQLEGEIRYVRDLETPHYELNGVVLQANFDLKGLLGYYVKVRGFMLDGPSIFMKERMLLRDFEVLYKNQLVELEGVVKRVTNLETPHYEVDGVVLQADFDLRGLLGYYIKAKGYMLDGPSIFMKERMLLKDFEVLYKNQLVELEGVVKRVINLETPHYELNGVVLQADFDLKGLLGYYVKVRGFMLDGPSIFMKERMLLKDFEVLNKGELLKMRGVVRSGLRFNGFILLSKSDLKPFIGKEVEVIARWDMEKSNAKQKYLQVIEIKEVKKRTQIVRERIDPVTGTRYTFRYYI